MFYPVTLINPVYQMLWIDNCLACLTWAGHMLVMKCNSDLCMKCIYVYDKIIYNLNGTWRTTQDNNTSTVHMALA
jgi:hypothetical protein